MVAIDVKKSLAVGALAMLASVAVVVSGQGADPTVIPQQQNQADALARLRSMFHIDPVVDTGVSELGGRKVYVHVPGGLFDLKLDTRPNNQGLRITQTVLGGLVNIYMDRTRDVQSSRLTGPISVKVAGMTMYQNPDARAMGGVPAIPPPAI